MSSVGGGMGRRQRGTGGGQILVSLTFVFIWCL